jgi:UDP-3-O-[3-hydroxymyristoyl] glucosamine N-acyltransferase
MKISASELAKLLNGTIEGDPSVFVSRAGKIEVGQEGDICFLGNDKYADFAYTTQASVLLVDKDFEAKQALKPTLIRVENVYTALAFLMDTFGKATQNQVAVISDKASIHPSVFLGKNVSIGDFAVLEEGVSIGDNCFISSQVYIGNNSTLNSNCLLYAGVKIYANSKIGANLIAHAGAVIGSDGFGFAPQSDGSYKKIQHLGDVIIEDDVEIGANTTIDKGSIGSTIIRKGVKLDNLIQVAHNVEIGENTVIAALTGISGSTKIGKNCRIGGQVGFAGHLVIGDNVQIQAQSGVGSNIATGSKLYGTPAIGYTEYLRAYSVFKQLPDMLKRLVNLEKKI